MNQKELISKVKNITGTNQAQLAKLLEITQGAISHWESSISKPSVESCINIHNVCKGKISMKAILESVGGKKIKTFKE